MENKKSSKELIDELYEYNELKEYNDYIQYNANRFLLTSVPQIQYPMGLGRKPAKYWITLRNWDKLLKQIIKFEEVYIYKKEKKYYYLTG